MFLASSPTDTDPRAIEREASAIRVELERSGFRDSFELVTRWAAEPLDLLRELLKLQPTVVHFSGPGTPKIDGASSSGLFFQTSDGRARLVSTEALAETFGAAGPSVQLIVLNACYSDSQATALLAHVPCVVGMSGTIHNDTARTFAVGFYGGLGECQSVEASYKQGLAAISAEGLPDHDRPQLRVRAGFDASRLILAATLHRVTARKT